MAESRGSLVKIISEKWVKPSSPTPPSSRYYKLSSLDINFPNSLTPMAFFFHPKKSFHAGNSSRTEIFQLLETSLSKTLTYYYPFAGRFMDDNITVECNDAGVRLWEVQIRTSMSDILNHPTDCNAKNVAFPRGMFCYGSAYSIISHLMVQFTIFECGGICVGFCLSHKLGDGQTLSNFVNDWASIARASSDFPPNIAPPLAAPPILSGASIFSPPPVVNTTSSNTASSLAEKNNFVTRRFVFSNSSISKLKKMVSENTQLKNPSRAEVVTAMIFKSATSANSVKNNNNNNNNSMPSLLMQIVNFRHLTIPPLSEKYVGNFVSRFMITSSESERKALNISSIVTEMRKSKVEFQDRTRGRLEGHEFLQNLSRYYWEESEKKSNINHDDLEVYKFSSCFNFPFYGVDFGWGKPLFVCMGGGVGAFGNVVILMSTPTGDGIEALITLKEDQMSIFEHDELLAFATLNPNIWAPN